MTMKTTDQTLQGAAGAFYRLVLFWAFSESFMGGFLHATRIPFKGIFLAGFSTLAICLIFYYTRQSSKILKAMILVLAIKALLSPHSPVGAYVAVALQGLVGFAFFSLIPVFRFGVFFQSIFAFITSAAQKFIVLTLLFGLDFWSALNQLFAQVLQNFGIQEKINFSAWLLGLYLGIYFLAGIIAAVLILRMPNWLISPATQALLIHPAELEGFQEQQKAKSKGKKKWKVLSIVTIAFVSMYFLQAAPPNSLAEMLLRAMVIICIWLVVIVPLLSLLQTRLLARWKNQYAQELDQIMRLLPEIRQKAWVSWYKSASLPGMRVMVFIKVFLANVL